MGEGVNFSVAGGVGCHPRESGDPGSDAWPGGKGVFSAWSAPYGARFPLSREGQGP